MAAINPVASPIAASEYQTHQRVPQKPVQSHPISDSVHLSKAALASLKGGDADHDGDSR